ncbi:MAG: IS66 family transposase [Endozoicomonas sp.]|uniref:IS66 family transposase n=1 Tax=Endozoicomonas sp. TaxID=1892382 RepID=UPI003D9BF599
MKHLVFGRKSEKTSSASSRKSSNTTRPPSDRKRGRQPGVPGNGCNLHNNLPVVHESVNLPVNEQCCATCHLPFKPFFNDAGCDVIEVEVKALPLSPATISFGEGVITPFFEPVAEAIREFVARSDQWHADETRWIVWGHEKTDSHKHWLWVFLCDQVVYFSIEDSRATVVPESVIGDGSGTLVCDRYSAYKKLASGAVSIIGATSTFENKSWAATLNA